MTTRTPIVDPRTLNDVLAELNQRAPDYVPEFTPAEGGRGAALLHIFSRYQEILLQGVNQVPEREALAFLDMMGAHLLPAQPARTPLVFTLMPTSPVDVTLGEKSQVAAVLPPPAPSISAKSSGAAVSTQSDPPLYYTAQTITLSRSKIAALYSVDPSDDEFADHTVSLTSGLTLFDNMQPVEHLLYLGHDTLFALAGMAEIVLTLDFGAATSNAPLRSILLEWEYLSKDGWLPLVVADDTTARFTQDGLIRLQKNCGPDAKQDKVNGIQSYWIRGRVSANPPQAKIGDSPAAGQFRVDQPWEFLPGDSVTLDGEDTATITAVQGGVITLASPLDGVVEGRRLFLADALPPLRPQGSDEAGELPMVDVIRAKVGFTKSGLHPEKAYTDTALVDTNNAFYPFGQIPAAFTTFYIASKEAFQKAGAKVQIDLGLARPGIGSADLALAWEYNDGTNWKTFDPILQFTDESKGFTFGIGSGIKSATITFVCPADWRESELNGVKNFWMRARIDAGNYGVPLSVTVDTSVTPNQVVAVPDSLHPPVIAKLEIAFTYFTNPSLLDHCFGFNDFIFEEHTEDARWPHRPFAPFHPIADLVPAVHFAFDQKPPAGLVSMFVNAGLAGRSLEGDSVPAVSPYTWEYRTAEGWAELGVLDETLGFNNSGMIQFVGPPDAAATDGLGGSLYRIRARLKPNERIQTLPIGGIWLNAVWGLQGQTVQQFTLGTSNGNPSQTLLLPPNRVPVLEGETVEVLEWTGRGDDWETAVKGLPWEDLRFERDPVTQTPLAVWVLWHEQPFLYASGPADRHYTIERSSGAVQFGDGKRGMIPPAGSTISMSFSTGGGLAGNVAAGTISQLRTGVPYLQGVTNPLPATGGAETEPAVAVRSRAGQDLRHRGRAIASTDYEWLARDASPGVARARCLQVTGVEGRVQRGWVTIVVVPYSTDAQPQPTTELLRDVQTFLSVRAPAAISKRIRIIGASYTPVDVIANIVPRDPSQAAIIEDRIRLAINAFLHPLTGGVYGTGWDFGQPVYLSQIARLIEGDPGVDYAPRIALHVRGGYRGDVVEIQPDELIAAGDHELKVMIATAI